MKTWGIVERPKYGALNKKNLSEQTKGKVSILDNLRSGKCIPENYEVHKVCFPERGYNQNYCLYLKFASAKTEFGGETCDRFSSADCFSHKKNPVIKGNILVKTNSKASLTTKSTLYLKCLNLYGLS